jgi:hypothetical protein
LDKLGEERRYEKYTHDKSYRDDIDRRWEEDDRYIRSQGFEGIRHPFGDVALGWDGIKPVWRHKYSSQ